MVGRGFINIVLGLWLLSAPATFGYTSDHLVMSDWICGVLAIIFGFLSIRHPLLAWVTGFIGLWLQFAPLVFWAPEAACYINDTLVGVLLMVFSFVVGGYPGVRTSDGPEIPPGWSFNPSSYPQRIPIIALNFCCWFIARYLAAFQLGYHDTAWDPVFGEGTFHVLTSTVSKSFPVSDAGMGAMAYTLEALLGFGDTRRWHTKPWLVFFFGILVVPVSSISIMLIILQPTVVGAWCFLCIVTAILMLFMIPFALDEVVAVLQTLRRARKDGRSLWKSFWTGVPFDKGPVDERTPDLDAPLRELLPSMKWGISVPWNLALSVLCGLAGIYMADYIPSALIIVFSVVSTSEVARFLRYVNILLGIWLVFSHPILGVAVIALAFRKGPIKEKYGTIASR